MPISVLIFLNVKHFLYFVFDSFQMTQLHNHSILPEVTQ